MKTYRIPQGEEGKAFDEFWKELNLTHPSPVIIESFKEIAYKSWNASSIFNYACGWDDYKNSVYD